MADSPGIRGTRRRGWTARMACGLALAALLGVADPVAAHAVPAGEGKPVIVRLEPGSDPDAQARAAAARGARVTFVYRDVFPGYAAVLPPGGMRGIEGGPGVVAVDPDTPVRLSRAEELADPGVGSGASWPDRSLLPWGLDRIDQRPPQLSGRYAPPAADRDGLGVTAYVIDSGIEADHDDLDGRVRSGFTGVDDGRGTDDCAGHGTHVAGTIGGAAHGVASAVELVAVRTLDCDGGGETSGVVAGIDWAARDHDSGTPAVANLSLAGEASDTVDAAIRGLVADGVTVAVAAGNRTPTRARPPPAGSRPC